MATKKTGTAGDLTTQILIQIRDEMRNMRKEQTATNERLEQLEVRHSEDTIRLATEVVAVAKAVGEVRDLLREQRSDRTRLEDHEERISRLENRAE